MALYTRHELPESLTEPVLAVHLEGWIDAGNAGGGAMNALLNTLDPTPVASFHVDSLLDQRARRPIMRVVDGVNTGLSWPRIELGAARDQAGRDLLLLHGPEPDFQWRGFARDVRSLCDELGVRLMVGLGAFPSPAPHTRPVPLVSTATTEDLARRVGFVPGSQEVSCGIHAVLERGFAGTSVPAIGIWARVPHYAAPMPYPAASLALLEALADLGGLDLDLSGLVAAAEETRQRLDLLAGANPQFGALVQQLEAQADAQVDDEAQQEGAAFTDIPSGDEIAAELERFLREQE